VRQAGSSRSGITEPIVGHWRRSPAFGEGWVIKFTMNSGAGAEEQVPERRSVLVLALARDAERVEIGVEQG
jgi:hypothetical protein